MTLKKASPGFNMLKVTVILLLTAGSNTVFCFKPGLHEHHRGCFVKFLSDGKQILLSAWRVPGMQ